MTKRSPRRAVALAMCAVFVLAACARSGSERPAATSDGKYGSGVDLSFEDKRKAAEKKGVTLTAPPEGAPSQPVAGAPAPPPPPRSRAEVPNEIDHKTLGTAALAMLRSAPHRRLVIEINAARGAEPRPSAITLMRQRLAQVLDKPDGIEVMPTKTFEPTKSDYTMKDVVAIEQRERTVESQTVGPTITLHVLYLNGELDVGALGVAYYSTSLAIFPDPMADIENVTVGAEAMEKATLVHEIGHILGLVNIGYESPRDHEDPEHKNHSRHSSSVMYYLVDSRNVVNILNREPPNTFHEDDLADLRDRKAGRLD